MPIPRYIAATLLVLAPSAMITAATGIDPPVEDEPLRAEDESERGFSPIFDGISLETWEKHGGGATYTVDDECIVGTVGSGPNTFLCTKKSFRNFVLRLDVRMDERGNSGIQLRSHVREKGDVVFGYQCELDPSDRRWTGGIYDESRRGWLFPLDSPDHEAAHAAFRPDEWNTLEIRCIGNRIDTWVNGVRCAAFTDEDEKADKEGIIGLQVHGGKTGRIRWRRLRVRELP